MATCTAYRILMNGILLPNIYFSFSDASQAFDTIKESIEGASCGRIVQWDDQTGEYN